MTTPNKGYTLPTVGASFGTWGTLLDSDLAIIDSNLGGVASVNCAGNANVTASASNAQNLVQQLTGALTGNISFILPAVGGFYVIENNTTGNFVIQVLTSAGGSTGVYAPQGSSIWVYSDGTNIISAVPQGWQEIQTQTATAASNLIFYLSPIFRQFRLTIQGALVTGIDGASLQAQISTDNGSTYKNSLYTQSATIITSGNAFSTSGTTAGGAIFLTPGLSASLVNGYGATLVIDPGSASRLIGIYGDGTGLGGSSTYVYFSSGGNWGGGLGRATNINITANPTTTFYGTYILEGLP